MEKYDTTDAENTETKAGGLTITVSSSGGQNVKRVARAIGEILQEGMRSQSAATIVKGLENAGVTGEYLIRVSLPKLPPMLLVMSQKK